MGKGKNRNKKGDYGSTSKEYFYVDSILAPALARTYIRLRGGSDVVAGSVIVKQSNVAAVVAPNSSKNRNPAARVVVAEAKADKVDSVTLSIV